MSDSSNSNTILENNITTNTVCGVFIVSSDCTNNLFYSNNFINNSLYLGRQAYDVGGNSWNTQYTYDNITQKGSGGNYWNDYDGNDTTGPEGIPDGIGDTPYTIAPSSAGNVDQYPLMEPKRW